MAVGRRLGTSVGTTGVGVEPEVDLVAEYNTAEAVVAVVADGIGGLHFPVAAVAAHIHMRQAEVGEPDRKVLVHSY